MRCRRGQQWPEVKPDHFVGQHAVRIDVAAEQRHRFAACVALARQFGMVEGRLENPRNRPVARMLHQRQHLWRRPAVMDVAIGQHQRSQPFRVMRGEDLRNGAAAVIGDQIDLVDAERVQHLGDHLRLRGEGNILRRRNLGVAEPHQVDGDTAPPMLDAVDDMAPVIAVDRHAMDEQRHRPFTLLEIGDAAGFDLGEAAAGVKSRDVHGVQTTQKMLSLLPVGSRK